MVVGPSVKVDEMQYELVDQPIEQVDGWVRPPDGPGLGVEVDESVVAAWTLSGRYARV